MQVGVIINPVSGSRRMRVDARVELARQVLSERGVDGEVVVTERAHHGAELARGFVEAGFSTVVAWGGDGTINEVASALAFQGPALGIVRGGSGNGLARELRIPKDPRQALEVAVTRSTRCIDAGELGGRLFFNVAGIGFDAYLARLFNDRTTRGPVGYFTSMLREVMGYEARYYDLRASDVAIGQRATLIALANTRQYGTDALIAPLARPDDGLLELVVLPALHPLVAIWHARRLFSGTIHEVPGVKMQSIREVQIASDDLRAFHVDGEVVEAGDVVTARIRPAALPVCVPADV